MQSIYSSIQIKAAQIVTTLGLKELDFPAESSNIDIILEFCAVTNPALKIQPSATSLHHQNWGKQNNYVPYKLAEIWKQEIESSGDKIRKIYIYS